MASRRVVVSTYAIIGATLVLLIVMAWTGEPVFLTRILESALEYPFRTR